MHIKPHLVTPTASIPPHTTKPRTPYNQQKTPKATVTNAVSFIDFIKRLFKPEKKGDVNSGN
jgi:hypothetical protein